MKFIFLNEKFYSDFNKEKYPEIEHKLNRPYVQVLIVINKIMFAIPLRSNINHKYAYFTDKNNKYGIDYSKAVIINDMYINKDLYPHIRQNEFNYLKGKDKIIYNQFLKYIKLYVKLKAKNNDTLKGYEIKVIKYSTLQYFFESIKNIK